MLLALLNGVPVNPSQRYWVFAGGYPHTPGGAALHTAVYTGATLEGALAAYNADVSNKPELPRMFSGRAAAGDSAELFIDVVNMAKVPFADVYTYGIWADAVLDALTKHYREHDGLTDEDDPAVNILITE